MTRLPIIPMNDLGRLIKRDRPTIDQAISSVLDSGWLIHGTQHRAFEDEFAAYTGSSSCVGVANGTDALTIALRAVGVGSGDCVVMVANAGFYAATACCSLGAVPHFVDVQQDTLNMDPAALRTALEHSAPKAVVVTHLYGGLADVEEIVRLCGEAGVPLIEDCAQATGARSAGNRLAGSFGDLGCFSFYPTKNLAGIGDGGAIVTNDPELSERCRRIRQYGWSERYTVTRAGENSRLDEIQAAVLRSRLVQLDDRNTRRRAIAATYAEAIEDPNSRLVFWNSLSHVAHLAVVRTASRDELRQHLDASAISSDVHYPIADDMQPIWQVDACRQTADDLSETHAAVHEIVSVPCFPEMTDEEVARVATSLAAFCGGSR
jgi:dTDP-4-amino-4,6-dideoxygalactose transaminase